MEMETMRCSTAPNSSSDIKLSARPCTTTAPTALADITSTSAIPTAPPSPAHSRTQTYAAALSHNSISTSTTPSSMTLGSRGSPSVGCLQQATLMAPPRLVTKGPARAPTAAGAEPFAQPGQVRALQTHTFALSIRGAPAKKSKFGGGQFATCNRCNYYYSCGC
ncbi:hypothetical protein FPV67DRAFT_1667408 [Lyophyllum atratum]|nr:hypothetical protein FPV67DRAFT_1667408 [Lyophyllum atratum]